MPSAVSVTLPMPTEATTNREELMSYFKLMYTMRRMEITCDTEYKVRAVCRQHCHCSAVLDPASVRAVSARRNALHDEMRDLSVLVVPSPSCRTP